MTNDESQDAETVNALTMDHRGIWQVSTLSSHYIFNLDEMTVTRYPGPTAASTIHDTPRHLATIISCTVGEGGHWTMTAADDGPLQFQELWSASSTILRIERVS